MSSLGEVLKQERERQQRTLKEVSDALNIKQSYLEALEKNEFDTIPGLVFVKGYTRNYGNYLGMNGAKLVQEYKETFEAKAPQPEVRLAAEPVKPQSNGSSRGGRRGTKQGKWPEITIIAGIIIFLLLIIWILI